MNRYICTNRNPLYKDHVEMILEQKKKQILDFFNVSDNIPFSFNVYIYDTIEDLVSGLSVRGFSDMPDYMCACQKDEDNSINYFEPKDNPSENEWSKDEYDNVIFHEEIHAIQYAIYGTQPEWLTEGVAKYIDGTYKKGIEFVLNNYIDVNNPPSMFEIENEFGEHEYDSYDYAYLMISYLIETMGKDNFLIAIKSKKCIEKMSEHLVSKSINYYINKYNNKSKSK